MLKKISQIALLVVSVMTISNIGFSQEEKSEKEVTIAKTSANRTVNITRSGVYRLSDDLTVRSGDGIVITASNVTLNLNGNTISTTAPGTGRGVAIVGASGVSVKNGKISGFNSNVTVMNSTNVVAESLQLVGLGLAPNNGPTEVGVTIINGRAVAVNNNVITSTNLGIFVRGAGSSGNRIFQNVIVGSGNPANNLLGICYNPAAGAPTTEGPRGDNIYNNVITRFNFALAISSGSVSNIFNENNLASFSGGFREPGALTTGGGTNISEGNLEVLIPATILP